MTLLSECNAGLGFGIYHDDGMAVMTVQGILSNPEESKGSHEMTDCKNKDMFL